MFRYLLRRLRVLIPFVALAVAIMLSLTQTAQAEGAQPYVNVSAASCVDGDGVVSITLYPGSQATEDVQFMILVDNQSYGSDVYIPVAPNTTKTVPVTGLADGSHRFEIIANDVTIFDNTRSVACDSVPTGPYSHPQGSLRQYCGTNLVTVTASNYPIGDNFVDLQSVTFTATFVSNLGGPVQTLVTVKLPSGDDDSFDFTHDYALGSPGIVYLYADGVIIQHMEFTNSCVVVPDHIHHHKKHHHKHHKHHNAPAGSALPKTGE